MEEDKIGRMKEVATAIISRITICSIKVNPRLAVIVHASYLKYNTKKAPPKAGL
jgi:hypothetical protein